MVKMVIKQSTNEKKKLMAIFYEKGKDGKLKKKKTTHFGQRDAPDFTITGDKEQRKRYRNRHTNSRENHSAYMTAGALSYHILWGASKSRSANISAYKRRFGLT